MAQIGDKVRFLNSVGGGVVTRIAGNIAYVEDEDGFESPVLVKELVVVGHAAPAEPKKGPEAVRMTSAKVTGNTTKPAPSVPKVTEEEPLNISETAEGDKLNVVLAYEPLDLKQISHTGYDTYIVNDSNYYLYFTYLTRADEEKEWTARYTGVVEPNIQLYLGEIAPEEVSLLDNVAVQYVAFKQDKIFAIKNPGDVHHHVDTTKFFKLHCFRDSVYFDTPVLELEIVRNDVPYKRQSLKNQEMLRREEQRKRNIDRKPVRKPVMKKVRKNGDIIEVDLHIDELIDNTRGLSAADMLNLQVDHFRRVMDENLKNHGQKIVFIHGKGEGVLRNALMKELNYRYKGHDVQDASFREYGYGATQVTIR
ncbi:MAG: DUF2027 domain-containing protein [Bacteroidales bacterium]|nr:DUF2027 domain-containing protein [Bacteroidales bacterium]MBD5246250.1 DUF2027 domain-containing protein [Barnesiella sp.]